MSEHNFTVGDMISSDDMTYEEMVLIFGKPLADALIEARKSKEPLGIYEVVSVIGNTITLGEPKK